MSAPEKQPIVMVDENTSSSSSNVASAPMADAPPYPTLSEPSLTTMAHTGAPAPVHSEPVSTPAPYSAPAQNSGAPPAIGFNDAPPPYQSAINYPTAAPYGQAYPVYPPKPMPNYGTPGGHNPPEYYPQMTNPVLQQPPVHGQTIVVTVGNGLQCQHCHSGIVTKETDMCCLMALILLTIFTFPFGLIFLCCIPCTVQMRCTNCRRPS